MNKIINANQILAKQEAEIYDSVHSEIFNDVEQERLKQNLQRAIDKISSGGRKALDLGCGTGNLTVKLLELDFEVTATDLTNDYTQILLKKAEKYVKSGKLHIIASLTYHNLLQANSFDFVGCYSVLHHVPDPKEFIIQMISWTKSGGIIYIDHETTFGLKYRIPFLQKMYDLSCGWLNGFYVYFILRLPRKKVKLDYSIADHNAGKIDHYELREWLNKQNLKFVGQKRYLLHKTKLWNPFRLIYRLFYRDDTICYVLKK